MSRPIRTARFITNPNEIGYAGYLFISPTQLYHVRNRDYQPEEGRWMQRDPAGYVDGLNLYLYAMGNPLIAIDPLGLMGVPPIVQGFWKNLGNWGAPASTDLPPSQAVSAMNAGRQRVQNSNNLNSFDFVDSYQQGYQSGGGSNAEQAFRQTASSAATTTRQTATVAGQAAALAAIAVPDPTDAAIAAGLVAGAKAAKLAKASSALARKLDNVVKDHLTARDLDAAARELAGEVVARKPDGTPFDHVKEVRDGQAGLENIIEKANSMLTRNDLSDELRSEIEKTLGEASKRLENSYVKCPKQ